MSEKTMPEEQYAEILGNLQAKVVENIKATSRNETALEIKELQKMDADQPTPKGESDRVWSIKKEEQGENRGDDRWVFETEELAHGGFATVYKGIHKFTEMPVIAKVVELPVYNQGVNASGENLKDHLRKEGVLLTKLRHPGIVEVLDYEEQITPQYPDQELPILIQRLEDYPDISKAIEGGKKPTLEEVNKVINEIANAVAYLKSQDIHHRDIKPSNIIWDPEHAKLSDFGVASPLGMEKSSTFYYSAPEAFLKAEEATDKSEVYSLAATAYFMLFRKSNLLENAKDEYETLFAEPDTKKEFEDNFGKETYERVEKVLKKGLGTKPQYRQKDATEFAKELSEAIKPPK